MALYGTIKIMDEYVYLIHTDTSRVDLSLMDFVGKIGKGSGKRYKSYTTPYGNRYRTSIIYTLNPHSIEQQILRQCKEKGYIRGRTETLYLPVSNSDTIEICKQRYDSLINDIINIFKLYGDILPLYSKVENNTQYISLKSSTYVDEIENACNKLNELLHISNITKSPHIPTISVTPRSIEIINPIHPIHPVQMFLKDYRWDDWMLGATVYNDYKEWCIRSGIQSVASNRFKIYADNIIEAKRTNKGVQYKKCID